MNKPIQKQIFKDPVDKAEGQATEEQLLSGVKSVEVSEEVTVTPKKRGAVDFDKMSKFDVSHLSTTQLQSLKPQVTQDVDPFEGYPYPFGRDATYVVVYNRSVTQDPSGRDYTVKKNWDLDETLPEGPFKGKTLNEVMRIDLEYAKGLIRMGKTEFTSLGTYHSRLIHNYVSGRNEEVVFDREIPVKDGVLRNAAIVPSHNVRAQLIFEVDGRTGLLKVSQHYSLLDPKQGKRLLKIAQRISRPVRREEELADVVEGSSTALPAEDSDITKID